MAYGLWYKNASGWYQISEARENMLAAESGTVNSAAITNWTSGPSGVTDDVGGNGADYPQIYVKPNTTWAGLGTSGYWVGCPTIRNSGKALEFLVSDTSKSLIYLTYQRGNNQPATGGYGLEIYDSAGDVQYSSNRYAPIPAYVGKTAFELGGSAGTTFSSSEPLPWVLINSCKIKQIVPEGLPGVNFMTMLCAYWNPNTNFVGITTFGTEVTENNMSQLASYSEIGCVSILKDGSI